MNEDKPTQSATSTHAERKKFALIRLVELIGGTELSRRTGLPKKLFYYLTADTKRGRETYRRVARDHASTIYDAAGEHIRELQAVRRMLRAQAFSQRRKRAGEDGEDEE